MDEPKTVAGLHCFDVLELLDDYVGETLDDDVRARVEQHLTACGACATFGGRYAGLVTMLRSQLRDENPPQEDTKALATSLWKRGRG